MVIVTRLRRFSHLTSSSLAGALALLSSCSSGNADSRGMDVTVASDAAMAYSDACYDDGNGKRWNASDVQRFEEGFELVRRILLPDSGAVGVGNVRALRLDGRGHALIVDSPNSNLKRLRLADGAITQVIGGPGRGPGEFRALFDVSIASTGHILTADPELARISIFAPDGHFVRQYTLPAQDPRLVFARSDSDYTVVGQSGIGRDERMLVRYNGASRMDAQLHMDPFIHEIDLILDAPWATDGQNAIFTGMMARPVIIRVPQVGAPTCRYVVPPQWKQLAVDERPSHLPAMRAWLESASVIDGAAHTDDLGLIVSYQVPADGATASHLAQLSDSLAPRIVWLGAPGRLLAATGDSLLLLGEPVGQQLPLLIYRERGHDG